jgi:hypothetical protein
MVAVATVAKIIDLNLMAPPFEINTNLKERRLTGLAARVSAVAGDLGETGGVFAGLAAIAAVFLIGASASRMRAFA